MKVKEESERAGLRLNIKKIKIMESGSTTSWQIKGENVEVVTDFHFLGSKITVDGDCSHEIKTLAPWKKIYDQPRQHIKKQRHYFANKIRLVKVLAFSFSSFTFIKRLFSSFSLSAIRVVLSAYLRLLIVDRAIKYLHSSLSFI